MTRAKYLDLCFQLEKEPDQDKMPVDFEDFPYEVQQAIITFGKLGDKIAADIGYLGKDYTAVPMYMDILGIEEKELFLETLARLDQRMIEKSAEKMKQERERLKNKK